MILEKNKFGDSELQCSVFQTLSKNYLLKILHFITVSYVSNKW